MKELVSTSKRAEAFIKAYWTNSYHELYQVYNRYSQAKARAFEYCKELCRKESGYDLRIISWNTFQFVAAWRTDDGEAVNLRVETHLKSYIIKKIALNIDLPF